MMLAKGGEKGATMESRGDCAGSCEVLVPPGGDDEGVFCRGVDEEEEGVVCGVMKEAEVFSKGGGVGGGVDVGGEALEFQSLGDAEAQGAGFDAKGGEEEDGGGDVGCGAGERGLEVGAVETGGVCVEEEGVGGWGPGEEGNVGGIGGEEKVRYPLRGEWVKEMEDERGGVGSGGRGRRQSVGKELQVGGDDVMVRWGGWVVGGRKDEEGGGGVRVNLK